MIWLAVKLLITLQVSKALPQNSSETVTNETENIEYDKEIPKYMYLQKQTQKSNDDLRVI